jgi:hypothetical protein
MKPSRFTAASKVHSRSISASLAGWLTSAQPSRDTEALSAIDASSSQTAWRAEIPRIARRKRARFCELHLPRYPLNLLHRQWHAVRVARRARMLQIASIFREILYPNLRLNVI